MEDKELDSVLQVLENPVRRKIIKRLSHGSSYPLQLSKELGLGQPLVAKHLALMEEAGVVSSSMEESPEGPKRRNYLLAKSISITLDMAPNLFVQRGFTFGAVKGKKEPSDEIASLLAAVSKISGTDARAVASLSTVLEGVDRKLDEIEEARATLLYIRNLALDTASEAIKTLEGVDKRRVIFSVLEEHTKDVRELSEALDMRETIVRDILSDLQKMLE